MSQNPHTAFPLVRTLGAVAVLLGLVACAAPRPEAAATANLQSTRGNTASGTVRFVQNGDKVQVTGEVKGLKPGAEHGFHVHEKGDCSSGDGMSTGGHFNPTGTAHGQHGHGTHHVGDLPSLMADAQGVAKVNFTSTTLTLKPGTTSIMDKGLIVHRDPDDYKTQPTGNSGPRVACGVIRAS
jgi:Cu-Zn family superoxide dismutase